MTSVILSLLAIIISTITLIVRSIPVRYSWLEKNEPRLVVSFEIVRGDYACVVIRNTGKVALELNKLKFKDDYLKKLAQISEEHVIGGTLLPIEPELEKIKALENTSIIFLPNQQWVLYLQTRIPTIIAKLKIPMEIEYEYCKLPKKKRIKTKRESVVYNVEHYGAFWSYKSELGEIENAIRKIKN